MSFGAPNKKGAGGGAGGTGEAFEAPRMKGADGAGGVVAVSFKALDNEGAGGGEDGMAAEALRFTKELRWL